VRDVIARGPEHVAVFLRHRVAHRVRQVDDRRAGLRGGFDHIQQEAEVATARVLRRKFHFFAILFSVLDHRADLVDRFLAHDS
jgi:hypothetical protein